MQNRQNTKDSLQDDREQQFFVAEHSADVPRREGFDEGGNSLSVDELLEMKLALHRPEAGRYFRADSEHFALNHLNGKSHEAIINMIKKL